MNNNSGIRVTAKASLDKLIAAKVKEERTTDSQVKRIEEKVIEEDSIPVLEQIKLMSINLDNLAALIETLKERTKFVCYEEVIPEKDKEELRKMPEVCEFAQVLITYNCRLGKLNDNLQFLIKSLQI